jgi:hypothetical protein
VSELETALAGTGVLGRDGSSGWLGADSLCFGIGTLGGPGMAGLSLAVGWQGASGWTVEPGALAGLGSLGRYGGRARSRARDRESGECLELAPLAPRSNWRAVRTRSAGFA